MTPERRYVTRMIAGEAVECEVWTERYACGHSVEYCAPWRGDHYNAMQRRLEHLEACVTNTYSPTPPVRPERSLF